MRCPHCGFEDPEDLAFCSECGRPQGAARGPHAAAEAPAGRSKAARRAPGMPSPAAPRRAEASDRGGAGVRLPARLVGLDGPLEGIEFALDRPEVGIGRRPDCEIRVPEHGVSRLHARIRATDDGYEIEDAGSANGTWVNDTCVEGVLPLSEGDVIRIGPCSFVFYGSQHAQASSTLAHPAAQLPPGSMTLVADVGQDPSPFGGEPLFADESPLGRSPTPSLLPSPWPGVPAEAGTSRPEAARDDRQPSPWPGVPVEPARQPGPAAPSAQRPGPQPVQALREQLGELNRDLDAYLRRLDTLAESLAALEGQLPDSRPANQGASPPEPLQELRAALATAGDPDQYRELRALLDELRSSPTDLRLLLRLSDQLPLVSSLVQAYVRAAAALRDLDRG